MFKIKLSLNYQKKEYFLSFIIPTLFAILLAMFSFYLYRDDYFTMYDLGVGYRSSYLFLENLKLVNFPTQHVFVSGVLASKLLYIPLSATLIVYNSPLTILIDQTIVIALGGVAIYFISRYHGFSPTYSLLFQLIYFLYPSTYGYLTHGGNFMVYFSGLFLIGYLFYLANRKLSFIVATTLASITNVLSPFVILFFYTYLFVIKKIKRDISKTDLNNSEKRTFSDLFRKIESFSILVGLLILIVLVLYEISYSGIDFLTNTVAGRYISPNSGTPASNNGFVSLSTIFLSLSQHWSTKLHFFVQMMRSFLFVPLFTLQSIPIAGYFVFTAFLNYPGFYVPLQQYPYLVLPFLFLGPIEFLSGRFIKILKRKIRIIVPLVLATILLSSSYSFFTISPFSASNISNGTINNELNYSILEKEFNYEYSLIPKNSVVFIQNDMPQLSDMKKIYMPGYYNNQSVDFAVFNPIGYNSITQSYNDFSSYWAKEFSLNRSYGVYAMVDSSVIYKIGYTGSPIYYVPYYDNISIHSDYNITFKYSLYDQLNYSFGNELVPSRYNLNLDLELLSNNYNLSNFTIGINEYNVSGALINSYLCHISFISGKLVRLTTNITTFYNDYWSFAPYFKYNIPDNAFQNATLSVELISAKISQVR